MPRYLPFVSGGDASRRERAREYDDEAQCSSGIIEFFEDVPLEQILCDPGNKPQANAQEAGGASLEGQGPGSGEGSALVCLALIPAFMIPGDIIHAFQANLHEIVSMRIFRHYSDPEKYLALLTLPSDEIATNFINGYNHQILSSIDPMLCFLYRIKNISYKHITSVDHACHSKSPATISDAECSMILNPVYPPNTFAPIEKLEQPAVASGNMLLMERQPYSRSASHVSSLSEDNELLRQASVNRIDRPVSFDIGSSPRSAMMSPVLVSPTHQIEALAIGREASLDRDRPSADHTPTNRERESPTSARMTMRDRSLSVASMASAKSSGREAADGVSVGAMSSATVDLCPVCLDFISTEKPLTFTMCCNHTFHIDCVSRLEGPQCPVCRFQHDSPHEALSECHVCGWIGTVGGTGGHALPPSAMLPPAPLPAQHAERDLWMCLVCGFIGCGVRHQRHMHSHYEETLHTYAMNTDSRHVWDFAGEGYVHRLILQAPGYGDADSDASPRTHSRSDGTESKSDFATGPAPAPAPTDSGMQSKIGVAMSNSTPSTRSETRVAKLVELPDPRNAYMQERPQRAPFTSQQEEFAVNQKLESAAHQYNQLLTWQLEQQRQAYEHRLRATQKHMSEEALAMLSSSGRAGIRAGTDVGGSVLGGAGEAESQRPQSAWAQLMLQQIQMEKVRLAKQCDAARAKHAQMLEECCLLEELTKGLQANCEEWQARVKTAEARAEESQQAHENWVSKLEEKVVNLMGQLDAAADAPSSSSQPVFKER